MWKQLAYKLDSSWILCIDLSYRRNLETNLIYYNTSEIKYKSSIPTFPILSSSHIFCFFSGHLCQCPSHVPRHWPAWVRAGPLRLCAPGNAALGAKHCNVAKWKLHATMPRNSRRKSYLTNPPIPGASIWQIQSKSDAKFELLHLYNLETPMVDIDEMHRNRFRAWSESADTKDSQLKCAALAANPPLFRSSLKHFSRRIPNERCAGKIKGNENDMKKHPQKRDTNKSFVPTLCNVSTKVLEWDLIAWFRNFRSIQRLNTPSHRKNLPVPFVFHMIRCESGGFGFGGATSWNTPTRIHGSNPVRKELNSHKIS